MSSISCGDHRIRTGDLCRRECGLSLIEMVIAMAVMSLVMAAFYGLITTVTRQWGSMEGQSEVQQQPRVAMGRIIPEIRQSRDFVIGNGGKSLGLVKATVLTEDAAAAATTICVEDTSPLTMGRPIVLVNVTSFEQLTFSATSGTCASSGSPKITVTALSTAHKQGELVRRAQSTLASGALTGATSLSVVSGSVFGAGDSIAVGNEAPITVSSVSGNTLTITPALAQAHGTSEFVLPALTRNGAVLADVANPSGAQLFSVVQSTLTSGANVRDKSLCVGSVVGFAVNDRVQVDRETYDSTTGLVTQPDRATITSIGGGCLTIDWGLTAYRAVGTLVRVNAISVNLMTSRVKSDPQQQETTRQINVNSKATLRN